ncbi:MAG TPA: tetratricopeptide repeat protein, partial [Thermoanaerobaculia bacterium]|nr:tetratricopeptide repeat protein [Thermoanaerobaculia bacterium]
CLTCHDPHRKVSAGERAAHYRGVCLTCHQPQQCPVEAHGGGGDCTGCHMPQRRTEDVVHVVMTDHRIQRPVPGADLVAPRAEHDPVLTDAVFLRPAEAPAGALGQVYGAVGVLRAGGSAASVPALEGLLAAQPPAQPEPWLRLAMGELLSRRYAAAEASLRRALATTAEADTAQVRLWLGLTLAGQGKQAAALAELGAALARDPRLVEARFDRGLLLLTHGRAAEALPDLEEAVALRPTFASGWLRLGQAREAVAGGDRAKREQAIAAYRRALAVEPSTTDAWLALGQALRAQGDAAGAAEVFALGARYARHPEALTTPAGTPPQR